MRPAGTRRPLPLCRALIACTLIACLSPATLAREPDDLGPFAALQRLPASVDAAAVFENPADTVLLSPVGQSTRGLLASAGVLTQTEHAWQALADAFAQPRDDTIRALLSRRVIVVWDGIDHAEPETQRLADAIDTRWALICQVDAGYLDTIRKALRPVKRDIVRNRAVYAIEQGRYRVALIEPATPDGTASVLLAPRFGSELLHALLQFADDDARSQPVTNAPRATITSGREPMLAEIAEHHQAEIGTGWSVAFIARIRTPEPITPDDDRTAPDRKTRDDTSKRIADKHILAAVVTLDRGSLVAHFGLDTPVRDNLPDAPVALYDAVADESVLAIASVHSPRMLVSPEGLSLSMSVADAESRQDDPFLDAPFLLFLSPAGDEGMSVCLALRYPRRDPGISARMGDAAMRDIIAAYDPDQAPDFAGRIPSAVRQIELRPRQTPAEPSGNDDRADTDTPSEHWPGPSPALAWGTSTAGGHDLFIASLAPAPADPGGRVRSIELAAKAIEAMTQPGDSGVLFRASLEPAEAMRIINTPSLADLALARLIRRLDIEVRRGVDAPVRGRLLVRFADDADKHHLGVQEP